MLASTGLQPRQGGPSDVSLVDYIRVSYWHTFSADNNSLRLVASSSNGPSQTIEGFTSPLIRVFDISDPAVVSEIAGQITDSGKGFAVTVGVAGQNRSLLAMDADHIKRPAAISLNQPSSLRNPAQGADLLVITRREFFAALAPLVALRQSQGLSVSLTDIEDIYDEFSFGNKSPQAVKDFIQLAATTWKKKPRFVLLAADASHDSKNYLGFGDFDLVPTKLIDTQFMETASDDWLADFNSDGVAELAVGRLPIRTASEAARLVAKLTGYDSSTPSEEVMLSADLNDDFAFETSSQMLRTSLPAGLRVNTVYRSQMDPATAKAKLIDAINQGQKIVNYTGHGSVGLWRGNLLTSADAASMVNRGRLTLFVMMTCLNGYYTDPGVDSLSESLLKAEQGGAVAVWASSGMCLPGDQATLNREFYRQLFSGNAMTIGEAARRAKQVVGDGDVRRTWILLGDPTMRLR
jgi:peptidase C25-like protein